MHAILLKVLNIGTSQYYFLKILIFIEIILINNEVE